MSKLKITAIVPMRHESHRVPGKNYAEFAGKPLYRYIIDSLMRCPSLRSIVIDTDSPTIMHDADKHYPKVQLLDRPVPLRGDKVPMNDVLLNTIDQVDADWYLQTHSTNPLLSSETIEQAIQALLDQSDRYDSLFSVTPVRNRFWDIQGNPINHDPEQLLRTQDLPPMYMENSCLYLFTGQSLRQRQNRIGSRPLLFPIDLPESWDIDDPIDFDIAEFLYKRRGHGGSHGGRGVGV